MSFHLYIMAHASIYVHENAYIITLPYDFRAITLACYDEIKTKIKFFIYQKGMIYIYQPVKTEGWYAFFDRPLVVCCFKLIF